MKFHWTVCLFLHTVMNNVNTVVRLLFDIRIGSCVSKIFDEKIISEALLPLFLASGLGGECSLFVRIKLYRWPTIQLIIRCCYLLFESALNIICGRPSNYSAIDHCAYDAHNKSHSRKYITHTQWNHIQIDMFGIWSTSWHRMISVFSIEFVFEYRLLLNLHMENE